MPIRLIEHKNFILTGRPSEATLMQTAYAQPDAGAIPDQQFNPVAIFIAKCVGIAIAGRLAQTLLHMQGKPIRAEPHVDWFNRQIDLCRR